MPSEDNSILESEGQSSCLGENTEQYIHFSVPTETEVKKIEQGFANRKWKTNYKNHILEITIS